MQQHIDHYQVDTLRQPRRCKMAGIIIGLQSSSYVIIIVVSFDKIRHHSSGDLLPSTFQVMDDCHDIFGFTFSRTLSYTTEQ